MTTPSNGGEQDVTDLYGDYDHEGLKPKLRHSLKV